MTTNSYQSERVDAMKVYQSVVLATMKDRSQLRKMGVQTCVELLMDGIELSFSVPDKSRLNPDYDNRKVSGLVKSILLSIQDIMWVSCHCQLESNDKGYTVSHTFICTGIWDISWPELQQHAGVMTFDDGGARL